MEPKTQINQHSGKIQDKLGDFADFIVFPNHTNLRAEIFQKSLYKYWLFLKKAYRIYLEQAEQ